MRKHTSFVALLSLFLFFILFSFLFSSSIVLATVINSTHADGITVYGESAIAIPRYRIWNASITDFQAELNAQSIGTGGSADITWSVVKSNPHRDEIILGTEDKDNDVNIQVYNSTGSWGNLQEVSITIPNSAHRAFDIAYEQQSGDALIVYENTSSSNTQVAYRIWNGSTYSAESLLTTTITADVMQWVALYSKPNSDDIMLVVQTSGPQNDIYAVPWNGKTIDTKKQQLISASIASADPYNFGFEWETLSGNGIVIYAEANDFTYRSYTSSSGSWSAESTIALGNGLDSVRLCADPTSNYIGIIFQDTGNDVNVRMWNGTNLLASPPTEDLQTEPAGSNNANVDCAWVPSGNYALFGFIDNNALSIDYFNFTKPNTWTTADLLTTANTGDFASNDIEAMRFTEHPTTNQIMAVTMDSLEDAHTRLWNGTTFVAITASPIEIDTEVTNGDQEG